MSRLHTGTVTRPRFESQPYKPAPARREFIHGPIRPMNDNLVTMGKRRAWFWTQFVIYSAVTLYALDLWIIH